MVLVFNFRENVIIYSMDRSKVIEVLKTLSADEMKSFRSYVHSPFFNTNRNVIRLFELLKKQYPDFNPGNIEKELLFRKLYPAKKYSDIVMRILISDMLKLLEDFLAFSGFSADNIAEKKYLLKELEQRKLNVLYNRHMKETEQIFEKKGSINSSYFLEKYEIESAKYDHLIAEDRQDRAGGVLENRGENLVVYFLMNGLNLVQEMSEFSEVLNYKFENNITELLFSNLDIDKFYNDLKKSNHRYYPLLEIYYNLHRFNHNNRSNEYFNMLKSSIYTNLKLFDESERNNLLLALESCAVTRTSLGLNGSQEDLMEIYEVMLSELSFSSVKKNYMQANLFRNMFYTALVLKRLDWAKAFVGKFADYLLPEQRPDMLNYTGAMLCFEGKKYNEALEMISKVNYTFFVFKYEAKVLMLKVHYELSSFEQALSIIDTFSHFLSKNKNVSDSNKQPFMNFLKFLKMLIKLRSKASKPTIFDVNELLKQVESMEHFISKKWITEKIKLLLNV